MDNRTLLSKNNKLVFPGMECIIEEAVGMGSNVIAYTGRYRDHQNPDLSHRVLIRELFPYDPQGGITRDSGGRLKIEPSSQELYDFNRTTFLRGNEVHVRLSESIPADLDMNINTFEYNNTLYSLLSYMGGRTLEEELKALSKRMERSRRESDRKPENLSEAAFSHKEDLLQVIRIVRGALLVLQSFHEAGYLHLDISPDNILLMGEGEKSRVSLIDYNSVHTMREIRGRRAVYFSMKEGYTAPEVRMGNVSQIREWTDLYSMTAVLYRCLTGTKLSTMQMIMNDPADVSAENSPFLTGCPESALSMLRLILRKGLAVTPGNRYPRASHMLEDLTELQDRIIGKGITHWALWERSRKNISRALQENTALDYIRDPDKIYPLCAETEDGRRISLMQDTLQDNLTDSAPILLLGGGGTGKTTALFRLSCRQNRRYSAGSTVVYYISLYGYRDKDPHYICDYLLKSLKYKPHTDSAESARRELMQLLARPLRTSPASGRPAFLLLLDGLNEASGDTTPLLEEIHALSALAGVRIILTSRSDPGDPCFRKLVLCRLEQTEIRKILADEGILPPENMEVFDLLSFPMMLSMYIRAVQSGEKQLRLESREQLLKDYFDAIMEKEKRGLPAEGKFFMGIEAAVRYLLPEIAALAAEKQRALTSEEMFSVAEKCYKELSGRILTVIYPEWLGYTAQLRLGAENADEWYGQAVLEILWKRLGLLVRDEKGEFRLLHQILEEYLADRSKIFHEKFDREKRRQKTWGAFIAMTVILAAATVFGFYFYSTSTKLARQQKELLLSESRALASSSEAKLKSGDREGALADALTALPCEGNERPFTASAEKALADALYLYGKSAYNPVRTLRWENDLVRSAMSGDGSVFVAVDEYGRLFCLDCKNGRTLWESRISDARDSYKDNYNSSQIENIQMLNYVFPVLRILEKSQTVFCAGENGDAVLLSLEDGREIWRLHYEDFPYTTLNYSRVYLAEVSHDEKTLVLGTLDQQLNTQSEKEYCRYLLFFDMSTGKVKGRYELLPENRSLYYGFNGKCVFSKDDKIFFTMLYDTHEKIHYFIPFDTVSKSAGPAVPLSVKNDGNYSSTEGLLRSEEGPVPGTYWYFCEYDWAGSRIGFKGTVTISFFPDGSDGTSFEKTFSLIGEANRLPEMSAYEGNLLLLSGNDIVQISQSGLETRTSSDKKILNIFDSESGKRELCLVFEDGGTGALYLPRLSLQEDPDITPGLSENRYVQAVVSGKWTAPFCLIPESDHPSEAVLCQYSDQKPLRSIPEPDVPDDMADELGNCLPITGTDHFLILKDKENEAMTNFEEALFYNDYYGTVYSAEGEILDSFSFTAPLFIISRDLSFTQDGKKMLCGSSVFDLQTHELMDLETSVPEGIIPVHFQSSVTQNAIFSALWDDGSLYLYENGSEKEKIHFDGEFQEAHMRHGTEYEKAFDFDPMLAGQNGLVILMGTDGEEISYRLVEGNPVDYYLVYSDSTGKLIRIPNASSSKGFPAVCAANKKSLFAAYDRDNRLIVYDGDSGEMLMDYKLNIDVLDIDEMRFVLDDQYLMIHSEHYGAQFCFVRLTDGETVFTYKSKEGEYAIGYTHLTEDPGQGRLYLYNSSAHMTGVCVCIDSDSWQPLFEIPKMSCVLSNDTLITAELILSGYEYFQYPLYTLEDMIRMGKELTGQ